MLVGSKMNLEAGDGFCELYEAFGAFFPGN
jgi:hypothetical protein